MTSSEAMSPATSLRDCLRTVASEEFNTEAGQGLVGQRPPRLLLMISI